ncbi:MAG: aconitase family protein [Eubacterium ramulus]
MIKLHENGVYLLNGTEIIEDNQEADHMFGLTCAKKYGGIMYRLIRRSSISSPGKCSAGGGKMILGSDSHTRYDALGTMAMGEGGPELVKQLLQQDL